MKTSTRILKLGYRSIASLRPERHQMKNRIVQLSKRTNSAAALFVAVASLVVCHAVAGAVATFQSGVAAPFGGGVYSGCQDTSLVCNMGNQTDQNWGQASSFEAGEDPYISSAPRHALIRFDVTSFAGHFLNISNVTLRLFVTYPSSIGNGDTLQVYSLAAANSDWVEGSGVDAQVGDPPDFGMSTWTQKIHGSANWAGSAGASTPGVDYSFTPLATFPYDSSNIVAGSHIDLDFTNTSCFLDWVAGTNAGLLLRTASEANSKLLFASSESDSIQLRPQLIVRYTSNNSETNLLTIRMSQAELCWPSTSNTLYQVQYRSELTTNIWTSLGETIQGNGFTNCVYDAILPGQPRRFYRFVTPPPD